MMTEILGMGVQSGIGETTKYTKYTKAQLRVALNTAGKRTTEYTEHTEGPLRSEGREDGGDGLRAVHAE